MRVTGGNRTHDHPLSHRGALSTELQRSSKKEQEIKAQLKQLWPNKNIE